MPKKKQRTTILREMYKAKAEPKDLNMKITDCKIKKTKKNKREY
jgi:hypothetical protein